MAELVRNVRSAQAPALPGARLEEDTVVAVLNTIHEIVSDSLDNARSLLQARGVPALVALGSASQSAREAKAASHVLQTVWSYKELRGALQRDGWTKARFQSTAANAKGPKAAPSPGGLDDSTLPLVDKSLDGGEKPGSRDMIPMEALSSGECRCWCAVCLPRGKVGLEKRSGLEVLRSEGWGSQLWSLPRCAQSAS